MKIKIKTKMKTKIKIKMERIDISYCFCYQFFFQLYNQYYHDHDRDHYSPVQHPYPCAKIYLMKLIKKQRRIEKKLQKYEREKIESKIKS